MIDPDDDFVEVLLVRLIQPDADQHEASVERLAPVSGHAPLDAETALSTVDKRDSLAVGGSEK